jgi:hypothetical protein
MSERWPVLPTDTSRAKRIGIMVIRWKDRTHAVEMGLVHYGANAPSVSL